MLRVKQPLWLGNDFVNAVVPDHAKLRNARLISPLSHGEACVGLSGLYAIVNGIRLVLAHKHVLTAAEVHQLMSTGMRFLDGRLTPQQALLSGLRVTLWHNLAGAMVEATLSRVGARTSIERLYLDERDRDAAFATLEDAILRMRVPMMLCRGGHYTVVSGFTRSSLLLFDSGGACWITKRLTGVPWDFEVAKHVVYPSSFLALVA